MDLGLNDRVCLVTAASGGIGRAVALRLANEGARVIACSRSGDALDSLANEAAPGKITPMALDLGSSDIDTVVETVLGEFGRLDCAVLNTPGPKLMPSLEASMSDWDAAYAMLVRPPINLATQAARHMVSAGAGSILFLTSTWVRQPAPGGVLSSSLRACLSAFAKQLALEVGPSGVRVNQLMPGATATQRMQNILASKAERNNTTPEIELDAIVAQIPLGRWAEPDEIADAAAFLSSPRAAFIHGQALAVDGGAIRSV